MILNKNKNAFTLIELIVGITILGILAFAISSMDFNRLNNKQKLDIFAHKIKTTYETARNNSMLGKGIGPNLMIPTQWKINFSTNNSGTIVSEAYSGTNISYAKKLNIPKDIQITSIKCGEFNQNSSSFSTMSNTGTIEFKGINISLNTNSDSNCDQNKDKILEITIKNKLESKIININTLNGLVETK